MKAPVDGLAWPVATNIKWFEERTFKEISDTDDKRFKDQLKHNVLKLITHNNKAFHEKIDAWQYFRPHKDLFGLFLKAVMRLALSDSDEFGLNFTDRYQLLTFLNYAFDSIEIEFVHDQIKRYLPLSIWMNLSRSIRERELAKLPKRIRSAWTKLEKQDNRLDPDILQERLFERKFIYSYLKQFLRILHSAIKTQDHEDTSQDENTTEGDNFHLELDHEIALYCQRFIEFVIDLESQLPLRRFFHAILIDSHLIVRCQLSDLARHRSAEGQLFNQLVELLLLYTRYEIDIITGDSLTDLEALKRHENDILSLQKTLWSKYGHLKKYAIKPVKALDNAQALYKIVTSFDSKEELFEFLKSLNLADDNSLSPDDQEDAPLMASILMNNYKRYESQMSKINSIPLFPNESVIWDTNLVPDQYYNYEYPLALPKLSLQYLTMSDYLLRNFMLFKNESTYEIRQDIEEGIVRSKCRWTQDGCFATGPKQRMALIIKQFSITDVAKPKLGEKAPSKVRAKVVLNMDYVRPEWKREWEQLRKHDTCFLVSFRKPTDKDMLSWPDGSFPAKNLVKYVRGCEIEGLLDSEGKLIDENIEDPKFSDNLRTYIVWLDCNQYQIDQDVLTNRDQIVYDKFHLMVRRKPEKNNFKGVLETIRNLINTKFVVPDWLRNLLIGYGDPSAANPETLRSKDKPFELDYHDTFLGYEHLKETFNELKPDHKIVVEKAPDDRLVSPFKVKFDDERKEIVVRPYKIPQRGPYPIATTKSNTIKFTPAQVQAITSGMQNGLTMVVGPPGTGKTDVAVQILANLYHSNPNQRTLIVTHSNQALNQIFGKMIELDVPEHHLLRMGHGEEDLDSSKDFSRRGRIRHVSAKRLELLMLTNKLARSLCLEPGSGLTCQSAEYFYSYHIQPRWANYEDLIKNPDTVTSDEVVEKFPFNKFFEDAPQPLFKGISIEEDIEVAKGCFRYIKEIFNQLNEFRPFEIFSNVTDRSQYLLIRQAKLIAMTCTHAGLRREELVAMNFQYDNILMEETAQILEIETTIPLLLQNPENGVNRLKRWIMIGDHNQLPPIIQNSAFQKFSNMEQSLFARFIRLGVPHTELDAQGRARATLCDLYRWRYKALKELPRINEDDEFRLANAGFLHEFQIVNVGDYNGVGESAPMPHFYQNLGEAKYVVAVYKYMRLIGYPSEKITILTTYNGQKQLLRDMIQKECAYDCYIGAPSKVTTVDKFQGQQNDFVLLSLVRTRTVGHLRDIRRLVVAMSRARLGLYVFARVNLFSNSLELRHSMRLLLQKPLELCLYLNESYPTEREMSMPTDTCQHASSLRVVKSIEEMQQLVEQLHRNSTAGQCEMDANDNGDDVGQTINDHVIQLPLSNYNGAALMDET